jgi:hypothetical protein
LLYFVSKWRWTEYANNLPTMNACKRNADYSPLKKSRNSSSHNRATYEFGRFFPYYHTFFLIHKTRWFKPICYFLFTEASSIKGQRRKRVNRTVGVRLRGFVGFKALENLNTKISQTHMLLDYVTMNSEIFLGVNNRRFSCRHSLWAGSFPLRIATVVTLLWKL